MRCLLTIRRVLRIARAPVIHFQSTKPHQVRRRAMRMRRLKLILLFRSVPSDDIKLRELLEGFGLIERFTPYVAGGRGAWHYSVQIADGDGLAASCAKWGFCWNDAHRSWAVLRGNFTGRSFLGSE